MDGKNTGADIQNGEKDTEKNAFMYKRLICGNARNKRNRTSKYAQKISEKSVKLAEMTNMYCIFTKDSI